MTETMDFERKPLENWKAEEERNRKHSSADVPFPPAMHPDVAAVEPRDAGAPRSVLHPVETPPPWPYAQGKTEKLQALEDFAGRIASIHEGEYGDWMRRANMYWWHLCESLSGEKAPVQKILEDMHRRIQFNPDFQILETRREVIRMAMAIRELIGASDGLDPHHFGVSEAQRTNEPAVPDYSERLENPNPPHLQGIEQNGNQGFVGKG